MPETQGKKNEALGKPVELNGGQPRVVACFRNQWVCVPSALDPRDPLTQSAERLEVFVSP